MDLHFHRNSFSPPHSQLPVQTNNGSAIDHSTASFQRQAKQEVLSVSSLVPPTVLTLVPSYEPTTPINHYSNFSFSSATTIKPQPTAVSSSGAKSPESQALNSLTPTPRPIDIQQPDGRTLCPSSVDLILPKDLTEEQTGMVIFWWGGGILYFPGTYFNSKPQSCNYVAFSCYENVAYIKKRALHHSLSKCLEICLCHFKTFLFQTLPLQHIFATTCFFYSQPRTKQKTNSDLMLEILFADK